MTLPSMMSAAELARIRAELETVALPDTCAIETVSRASDGAGGINETWAASSPVACRLDHKTGLRHTVGTSWESFSGWVLTLPQSTAITTANRVVHQGQTYSVSAVDDLGSWLACKRVMVERVWR